MDMKLDLKVFILGGIILLLKLLIIDIDLPAWDLAQYSPIDELYYAINGYNQYEIGNLYGIDKHILFGNSNFLNFTSYITLNLFGDNYLGLRTTSFIFGFLSYILIYDLLRKVVLNKWLLSGVLLFIVANFTLANASFIVEPSIIRIFCALLSIKLMLRWSESNNNSQLRIIDRTAFICLLWLLCYPTNMFIIPAIFLLFIVNREDLNKTLFQKTQLFLILKKTIFFVLGLIIGFVGYYLFNKLFGSDVLDNMFNRGGSYSNRLAFSIKDISKYFLFTFRSNIFVLNPLFLMISVITLFNLNIKGIKSWSKLKYTTFVFLVALFLQSLIINDFPERKLILFLPFVIILSALFINDKLSKGSKNEFQIPKKQLLLLFVFMSIVAVVYYKYSHINIMGWIFCGLGFITLLYHSQVKRIGLNYLSVLLFVIVILPEITNTLNHHILNRTYHYKNAFLSLKEYDDTEFIGGFSLGFRAYNSIIPSVNAYYYYGNEETMISKVKEQCKNGKKDYSIHYKKDEKLMDKMGFIPLKPLLSTKENTVWYIYEEKFLK